MSWDPRDVWESKLALSGCRYYCSPGRVILIDRARASHSYFRPGFRYRSYGHSIQRARETRNAEGMSIDRHKSEKSEAPRQYTYRGMQDGGMARPREARRDLGRTRRFKRLRLRDKDGLISSCGRVLTRVASSAVFTLNSAMPRACREPLRKQVMHASLTTKHRWHSPPHVGETAFYTSWAYGIHRPHTTNE